MNYNLQRFKDAQKYDYQTALKEIRNGRKKSHWIWYIYPQLDGLGTSNMCKKYGIQGIEEAKAYLADPLLRERLEEISQALLDLPFHDAHYIMSDIDVRELQSSMTLFTLASNKNSIYQKVLDQYYQGKLDPKTVEMAKKKLLV